MMAHNPRHTTRALVLMVIASLFVLASVVVLASPQGIKDSDARPTKPHARSSYVVRGPQKRVHISVGASSLRGVQPLRAGFVGVSIEFNALHDYTGTNPHELNPLFERLVRALAPGQRPVLRIGGDSTDWTWWPMAGIVRSPGLVNRLTPSWMARSRKLLSDLHARAIVGVNLEAGIPALTVDEAHALLAGLGRRRILAVEIGNEPPNYPRYAWYRVHRRPVFGRGLGYDFGAFQREFDAVGRRLPGVPLAGPALAGQGWMVYLPGFLATEPSVSTVTLHRYPLRRCFAIPGTPMVATLSNLLAPTATSGFLAPLRPDARLAHAHHATLRLDELNSVSCGGKRGLSDRFVSALWALDALFEAAKAGVDGVNIHTFPRAAYGLFTFSHRHGQWRATVRPEYYGLLMFVRAAPPGARLLATVGGAPGGNLKIWATRSRAGTIRVVLINKSLTTSVRALVRVGSHAPADGRLERLIAPSALARHGITLAGQHFAQGSTSATLTGTPQVDVVRPRAGVYGVSLGPASAALLTLPGPAAPPVFRL
jgi:hypothetical protein